MPDGFIRRDGRMVPATQSGVAGPIGGVPPPKYPQYLPPPPKTPIPPTFVATGPRQGTDSAVSEDYVLVNKVLWLQPGGITNIGVEGIGNIVNGPVSTTPGNAVLWDNATGTLLRDAGYPPAPLVSPQFTGTPTAPTPPTLDSSNNIATTAFVENLLQFRDAPADGSSYVRNTNQWVSFNGASVGASPPSIAGNGSLWWDSNDGQLYVYYDDGNSKQWVITSSLNAIGGGYLPLAGGTLSGLLTGPYFQATSFGPYGAQGAYLMWNRVGDGLTDFVNNRGLGLGGFNFIDSDGTNDVSLLSLTRNGAAFNGPVNLPADPSQPLQAATKHYVDGAVAGATAGGPFLPLAGGTITGPLQVNNGAGISYDGSNNIKFTWSGTAVNLYIDGATQGRLATQSWVNTSFLPVTGGTVSGTLTVNGAITANGGVTLAADPTTALQAATKQYVDAHAGSGGGGIPDAPNDGNAYLRASAAWASGGTLTGNLTLNGGQLTINNNSWTPLVLESSEGTPCVIAFQTGTDHQWWAGAWAGGSYWISDSTAGTKPIICTSGGTNVNFVNSALIVDAAAGVTSTVPVTINGPAGTTPLAMSVPSGQNCLAGFLVSGTRQWQVGPLSNGAFVIQDANTPVNNLVCYPGGSSEFDGYVTFTQGLNFGNSVDSAPDNFNLHLSMFGSQYGIGITGSRMNYVVPAAASHYFRAGGNDILSIGPGGTYTVAPVTINATTIPLTVTGATTGGAVDIVMDGATASWRNIRYRTAGADRWVACVTADAETGGSAGSNFELLAYSDGGVNTAALYGTRSTALLGVAGNPTAPLGIATKQYVDAAAPASVKQVPVPFTFAGKPSAGALVNVPVAMAMTIAASLAGTTAFRTTAPASNAVFVLNKISGGVTTQLGQVILVPGTTQTPSLSGPGGSLVVGDALQMVAPSSQDATLADVGITILAARS